MTSEEAIKYLKKMKDECNDKFHKVRYVTREEALDMAIKALEQEPKETWSIKDVATTFERHGLMTEQEPCEDCISRKAILSRFEHMNEVYTFASIGDLRKVIGNMPSIQPKLKTGRWIGHGEHCENLGVIPSGLGAYKWCSNCDCGIDVKEWHRNNYNFCPNCGAKMESEDTE